MSPPDGPPHDMVVLTASVTMPNKRKRGRNLCTKFKKLRENGLILITIPPGAQGPMGEIASVFTRRVGFIVCEHVNLSYQSWSKAPQEHQQMLKNFFVADCTLDPNCVEDKKCMEISLSCSYNNVWSNYYKEYLTFSKEEVRANVPPDLTQDKWDALCDLYETQPHGRVSQTGIRRTEERTILVTLVDPNHLLLTMKRKNKVVKRLEKWIFTRWSAQRKIVLL
ncbi:hypothetical protein SO802_025196 [Lithocarpus litseifolius]|uniref:Uncharacterized protein n=1 Tax=Lithocarpus litseifolius TaxID=425828 RepID=A0AAW2BW34_9ROSI